MVSNKTSTSDTKLLLCDGTTLTAPKGICVPSGESLTIYGQSGNTGVLKIDGMDSAVEKDHNPGIGGSLRGNSGTITINGGKVIVKGYYAGIGTGYSGHVGAITINGGEVEATGGDGVAQESATAATAISARLPLTAVK